MAKDKTHEKDSTEEQKYDEGHDKSASNKRNPIRDSSPMGNINRMNHGRSRKSRISQRRTEVTKT